MTVTTSPITLMMAIDKPQYKVFYKGGNEEIQSTHIHPNNYWASQTKQLSSLEEMFAWFDSVQKKQNLSHMAVMRGVWKPDAELLDMEEKRKALIAGTKDPAPALTQPICYSEKSGKTGLRKLRRKLLMDEVPLHWICFDFDGAEVEGIPFSVENPRPAVDAAIKSELGDRFSDADYILQLSSSAGIKEGIRAHIWFWMSAPWTGAQWKAWFKERGKVLGRKPYIDPAMFGVERIHYIAPPTFKSKTLDPMGGKSRWSLVNGDMECVYLSPPEVVQVETVGSYLDTTDLDIEEAQDAWSRPGIVGIFNRCYSMSETLETFLSDKFRIDDANGRVTWLERSDVGGCKIFAANTKLMNSHGNNDPREGQPGNAFDIVQTYLHGGDFQTTATWAETLDRCIAEKEKAASAEFDVEFEPTPDFVVEIAPTKEGVVKPKVEVLTPEKVMELYPMPKRWQHGKSETSDACYRLTEGGWKYGYIRVNEETDKKYFVELWSPITVWNRDIAIQNSATTLHVRMMNHKGEPLELSINRGETMSKTILGTLWGAGWSAGNQAGEDFVNFLRKHAGAVKNTRMVSAHRGWFSFKSKDGLTTRAFAAPSGKVYGAENLSVDNIALRSDWILQNAKGGTLEGWKSAVRDLCAVDNVPHWILGVASGLVGPLMELYEGDTSGIVFGGDTSRGKTTALGWAASVWSSPDERRGGMMKNLRTTANAVENLALGANGTVLLLDETNLLDGRLLEGVVYTIASGSGKQRLRTDGSARDTINWSTFTLMSGESGLAQRFEQASGKKMGKGAAVRLLDFDITNVNAEVPIETIRNLKEQISANYGWAGEAFVEKLVSLGLADDTRELWQMRKAALEALAGKNAVGVTARAASILSTLAVAVRLGLEWEILPPEFKKCFDAAVAEAWRQVLGGAVFNSHFDLAEHVRLWIHTKWDRSIVEVGSDRGVRDIEAWYDKEFIYVPPEKLIEATNGVVREGEIRKALCEFDCLESFKNGDKTRFTFQRIPGVGAIAHYRLKLDQFREKLGEKEQEATPEDLF